MKKLTFNIGGQIITSLHTFTIEDSEFTTKINLRMINEILDDIFVDIAPIQHGKNIKCEISR
ncbi:hypothetical protein GCM10027037_05510 [Mucilaginibacter koreensis]